MLTQHSCFPVREIHHHCVDYIQQHVQVLGTLMAAVYFSKIAVHQMEEAVFVTVVVTYLVTAVLTYKSSGVLVMELGNLENLV